MRSVLNSWRYGLIWPQEMGRPSLAQSRLSFSVSPLPFHSCLPRLLFITTGAKMALSPSSALSAQWAADHSQDAGLAEDHECDGSAIHAAITLTAISQSGILRLLQASCADNA